MTLAPVGWDGEGATSREIVDMTYGNSHLLVIVRECSSDNRLCVYSYGLNDNGQLGHGVKEDRQVLTKIPALEGKSRRLG